MSHTVLFHSLIARAFDAAFLLFIVYLQAQVNKHFSARSEGRRIVCRIPPDYEAPLLTQTGWVWTRGKRRFYSPEEAA